MSSEAIFEDKQLKKFFSNLDKNLEKVKDGKKQFAGLMSSIVYADVMDHFEKEQGQKSPWASWSKSYTDYMEKIGRSGNGKLKFTGHLRQNFKPTDFRSVKNGITWFNNAQTKKGFPYAFAHDEGGSQLPQREFMWLSDSAAEKMAEQTLAFILEKGL